MTSTRQNPTVTNDFSLSELRKILKDDFNFLPNWVSLVDPTYDFDFCGIDDSTQTFYRGGQRYYRPIGWKRFALKVNGRYENDEWLEQGHTAWLVAYHGTEEVNCNPITAGGFAISSRGVYGSGVYVSPLIDFASAYARPVTLSNGMKIAVVLQTRVKPGSYSEHHKIGVICPKGMCESGCKKQFASFDVPALEYVVKKPKHVRPYGICVKLLTDTQASQFQKDAESISSYKSKPKGPEEKPKSCSIM